FLSLAWPPRREICRSPQCGRRAGWRWERSRSGRGPRFGPASGPHQGSSPRGAVWPDRERGFRGPESCRFCDAWVPARKTNETQTAGSTTPPRLDCFHAATVAELVEIIQFVIDTPLLSHGRIGWQADSHEKSWATRRP